MEFRCDECAHVGAAAEVKAGEAGVVLVCEKCGHENRVDVDRPDPDGATDRHQTDAAGAVGRRASGQLDAAQLDAAQLDAAQLDAAQLDAAQLDAAQPDASANQDRADGMGAWLRKDALEALVPEPGEGPRCQKCAHILDTWDDHCTRCGLSRHEASRYGPGEAPWERPPEGKQSEHEQAQLLWQSYLDQPSNARRQKFTNFVAAEQLLDLGIRRLRFHLVDHPDDDQAGDDLRELAESLQSRVIVATAQAEASADQFQQEVSRFKHRMVGAALVALGGIVLFMLVFFWDNCAGGMPHL